MTVRYKLEKNIGKGTFGITYKAKDLQWNDCCAIKLLLPQFIGTEGIKRFYREINILKITSNILHLVKYRDSNTANLISPIINTSAPFLAMEWIDGTSLEERNDFQTLNEVLEIIRNVAEALHSLHIIGIIHRDIKPSNIMINQKKEAILIDLGLALDQTSHSTRITVGCVGTQGYIAPEAIMYGSAYGDEKMDIYSLGVLLFKLLTGYTPFPLSFSTNATPNWGDCTYPSWITNLCNDMLKFCKDQRPTAKEVIERIQNEQ